MSTSVASGSTPTAAPDAGAADKPRFSFGIMARYRLRQALNAVDLQLREAPMRTFAVLVLLAIIWTALYWLLAVVLRQVGRWELVAVVANLHIFVHFFLVLAVMLAFSNAILAYGSLFGRQEAGYLLVAPAPTRQTVCIKWLEAMALSSWSFLLLGVPLMLAVSQNSNVEWYYYPLFIGHFIGFIILPSTLGLLVAWMVAMFLPRRPLAVLIWCAALLSIGGGLWAWKVVQQADASGNWVSSFYAQVSIAKQPFLPTTWSAKGVIAAMQRRADESLMYLAAVLANGAFLAWITINLLGRSWGEAYDRAMQGRGQMNIRRGWFTHALCWVLFFYLPRRLRMIMLKDLRGFVRDAPQWSQMVIMMGLLLLYALKLQTMNLRWLPMDFGGPGMRVLLAFLNLVTISLILATFTSRFVYPLLSLESQQLWLLGLLPTRRSTLLAVKFVFSLTITSLSALAVMSMALVALELPAEWARLQIAVCLSICIGLSGLAVGIGARFPVLGQRNPARIAAGFGGTVNLTVSMLFVGAQMTLLAIAGLSGFGQRPASLDEVDIARWLVPALVLFGVLVAGVSLWIGGRHFERLEV